ncbi:MAG TPA: hypothetical protein VHS06_12690 [Chloroflexota bacterium]|nr:hypothetical protein [Chloroflexota bacterium]
MRLADLVADLMNVANPRGWRSPYDFESPDLSPRERLVRLEYAALQAWRQSCYQADRDELEYALQECRALLALDSLEGEVAVQARVNQRTIRIVRVVKHHEGQLTRMNRHFWWVPFSIGMVMMISCCLHCIGG